MGKQYAIALSAHGPCFGEMIEADKTGITLKFPTMLIVHRKSEDSVERTLVQFLASVDIEQMFFNCPWAIVSDAKLERMHDRIVAGKSGLVLPDAPALKVH